MLSNQLTIFFPANAKELSPKTHFVQVQPNKPHE